MTCFTLQIQQKWYENKQHTCTLSYLLLKNMLGRLVKNVSTSLLETVGKFDNLTYLLVPICLSYKVRMYDLMGLENCNGIFTITSYVVNYKVFF